MSDYTQNSLIAYDTTSGEIIDMVATTLGVPPVENLSGYNSAIHSLTGSMNVFDADDFDSNGNLTDTACEKYDVATTLQLRIVKDKQPWPDRKYDRVHVTAEGKLDYFSVGPVPLDYRRYIDATISDAGGSPLVTDTVSGLPRIPADGTTTAVINLQKYDHTGVPMAGNSEWFSVETDGGRISYRRVQLDANGQASVTLTASTEEKMITVIFDNYYPPGPVPLEDPIIGTSVQIYCGDDDYPAPAI